MLESLRPSERMLQAVIQNQPEELLAALKDGANPNFQRTKNTPLILALANGNKECADLLVEYGADVNLPNGHGWMAIHEVCQRGWMDWVEKLAANPMNRLHRGDNQDATPLLVAVQAGQEEVAAFLISQHADVNAQNEQGVSPLMLAIERQSKPLVEKMMAAKGNPSLADKTGRTGRARAENWPEGQSLLGGASVAVLQAQAQAPVVDAVAQEAGVSGIQKRRRPA